MLRPYEGDLKVEAVDWLMETVQSLWLAVVERPRYLGHVGLAIDVFGITLIAIGSVIRGPVGSKYSGRRDASTGRRQGPRPGHEADDVIRRRWRFVFTGIAALVVGVVLQIVASEMQAAGR